MMSEYLDKEDYVPQSEDLLRGEQIHINHDNCPAGVDTKRRLYIKRTDDGTNILAYCHNCSNRGSHGKDIVPADDVKERVSLLVQSGQDGREANKQDGLTINDVTGARGEWGVKQRVWVTKYGITDDELTKYKIGYSERNKSIVLPVYRDNKLLGYQERTFDAKLPKYITTTESKPLWWYSEYYNNVINSPITVIVLVEDMLSGVKCARFQPTIALLGAAMGDKLKEFIINTIADDGKFIIFLDDDNRQVRLSQLRIKVALEQIGYRVKLITGVNKDPKECSNKELEELLKI